MTDAAPSHTPTPAPSHDLVLERVLPVPRAHVWRAWTDPEALKRWFCPRPWQVADCRIDLRPGGEFHTLMRGPAGEEFAGTGCYLEVVPERRLIWTSALGPDFRPNVEVGMLFTCVVTLEDAEGGTHYVARAMHASEAGAKAHADMGFHDGWGKALDQLVELARGW